MNLSKTAKARLVISYSIQALLCIILILLLIALNIALNAAANINGYIKTAIPKLDSLNQNAITQIPRAPGLQLINAGTLILGPENDGGGPLPAFKRSYTVWQSARYLVTYTPNGPIVDYYKKYFQDQGWRQYRHIKPSKASRYDYYEFHQGATCAALIFDPEDYTLQLGHFSSMTLRVWHDFWDSGLGPFNPLGLTDLLSQIKYDLPKCPL